MSLQAPDSFWMQRWKSLSENMMATIERAEDVRLKGLLENLLDFGRKQFLYFYFGFMDHETVSTEDAKNAEYLNAAGNTLPIQNLVRDYTYPPEYVLRTIIDQITYDYGVIQRAMHQRSKCTDAEKKTLNLADRWGEHLLNNFSGGDTENRFVKLLDTRPLVITYFNRSPHIRMIPYANVALVGIPLTSTSSFNRRDLLVIPHELGHYVFWHGRIGNKSVHDAMTDLVQAKPLYAKKWIEELFADTFAMAAMDTPRHKLAMVYWVLSMIKDNPPDRYWSDNETHPVDAIRMYVYLDRSGASEETVSNLRGAAQAQRRNIGPRSTLKIRDEDGNETTIELDDLRVELATITGAIENHFLINEPTSLLTDDDWQSIINGLSKPPAALQGLNLRAIRGYPFSETNSLQDFHEIFLSNFSARIGLDTILQILNEFLGAPYLEFEGYLEETFGNADQEEIDIVRSMHNFETIHETNYSKPVDPSVWKLVFSASGWAIKGPETSPGGDWEPTSNDNPLHF